MKHMSVKTLLILATITLSAIYSCTKRTSGPQGTANVKVYKWGPRNTGVGPYQSREYYVPRNGLSMDGAAYYIYLSNTIVWYPLPGTFDGAKDFFTVYFSISRTFTDSFQFSIQRVPRLSADPLKPEAMTFDSARAVIIPVGTLTNLRTANINFNDYEDVKKKLHLKDEDEILLK